MKSFFLTLLAILLVPAFARGQSPAVEISAFLSAGVVKRGASVELTLIVEGATDMRLGALPDVPGLRIGEPSRPAAQVFQGSFNGRATIIRRATVRVPIATSQVGTFVLPSIEVEAGGESATTRPLTLRVVEDMQGSEFGYFDVALQPTDLVDGQPFTIELTFGWDESLASRINHADLSLPWWGRLPGAIPIESDHALGGPLVSIDLNGEDRIEVEELGRIERDGRRYRMFRLRRDYLATSPGTIELPAASLEFGRYSQGSLFEQPKSLETYYKSAPPARLEVQALPDEGRPIEFSGAVGTLTARAEASPREVEAGESVKVRVTWTGDGNLEFFELPDLSHAKGFEGFSVYGATDEVKSRKRRVAVFDLAPRSAAVREIPPIPLTLFDSAQRAYRVESTQPIPIRVFGLDGVGLEPLEDLEPVEELNDLMVEWEPAMAAGERAPGGLRRVLPIGAGAVGLLLVAALLRPRVRRGWDPASPRARGRRRALRTLQRELTHAGDPSQRLDAFCGFLAARSGTSPDAWHGQRFGRAQVRAAAGASVATATASLAGTARFAPGRGRALPDLEPELADRVDAALEELEAAAWRMDAQGATAPDNAALTALASELQEAGL